VPFGHNSDKLNEAISRELIARFGTMSQALINRHVKNIYNIENVLQNSLSPTEFRNISIEESEGEESNELNNVDDSFDDSDSEREIAPWRINFLKELTLNHWTSKRKQILLSRDKYLAMIENVRQFGNDNNEAEGIIEDNQNNILSQFYPSFSSSTTNYSSSSFSMSTPTNLNKKPYLKYKIVQLGEEKIIEMLAERKDSERLFLYNEQIFDVLYKIHMDTRHGRSMSMYSMIKNKFANITIEQIKLFLNSCEGCKNWNKNEKKLFTLLANNPNKEKKIEYAKFFDFEEKTIGCRYCPYKKIIKENMKSTNALRSHLKKYHLSILREVRKEEMDIEVVENE
uniref:BED-type domain-containing protein n=1 Tax=Meloidogyne javanica TaxID=6303 RepID=A0A915MJQ3_MELJA